MVAGYQADIDPDDFAPAAVANIRVKYTISNTLFKKNVHKHK